MNKLLITLTLILSIQFVVAQDLKFGDISKEELLEKSYDLDSSANAVILYKYRNTYFRFYKGGAEMVTEIQERIKIYNQQGFEYATKSIGLFKTRRSSESISKIKAYTYNLLNDKIVKTELDKDQIFKNERSYNFNEVKFTMPKVQEGSIIELKYKISSPYYSNIDEFRLQYGIPVKRIEAHIRTPKGFNFKQTQKGYLRFMPKRTTYNGPDGNLMVDNTFKLNNIPALKEEIYVDNIDNYRAGVMFELVSIDIPPTYFRSYAQTWGDVAKTIGNSKDYEKELDKSNSFDDELNSLLPKDATKVEKMKLIFKYVKDHIKWNGRDGKYFQYGLKEALKEEKGNAADINLMLVAMLRFAGIEANPVVISTKDNGIPFFPTLDRLNYVLAYAEINGKTYFMDATDEFSDINLMPIKDYNWQGILINNNKMVWTLIDIKKPKQSIGQYQINAVLSNDGSIDGTFNSRLIGHYASNFKESLKNQDTETFITERENVFDDIEISDYETKNTDSYEGNVSESFTYYQENGAEIIDDKIIIQPLSFLRLKENPFKSETREFPIDFAYAFKNMYVVNIELPEGYEVESQTKPFVAKTPEGDSEFKYIVSVVNNKIQVSVTVSINRSLYGADSYLILKEYFNQIVQKEGEQIVLKKI